MGPQDQIYRCEDLLPPGGVSMRPPLAGNQGTLTDEYRRTQTDGLQHYATPRSRRCFFPVPLAAQLSFLTDLGYVGWFRYGKSFHPFSEFARRHTPIGLLSVPAPS
jgi:hypothetical protein